MNNPFFFYEVINQKYKASLNVNLLFHLPESFSVFILEEEVFKAYISHLERLFKANIDKKVKLYTIHLGNPTPLAFCGEKRYVSDIFYEFFKDMLEKRIKILDELAENYPLAVENAGGFHKDEVRKILKKTENLKFTMDIGHLESVGEETKKKELAFFKKMRKRIVNIHLHDNHKLQDEHLPIGKGKINFFLYKDFILHQDPYIIIEVRPVHDAMRSLGTFKQMFGLL